jgi:hypothetical protein
MDPNGCESLYLPELAAWKILTAATAAITAKNACYEGVSAE